MKTGILIGALTLLAPFAAAAQTEPRSYEPYEYELQHRGTDKRQTYERVVAQAPTRCDTNGGYVANVRYTILSGWGAAAGTHYVKAEVLCKPERPTPPPSPVADLSGME